MISRLWMALLFAPINRRNFANPRFLLGLITNGLHNQVSAVWIGLFVGAVLGIQLFCPRPANALATQTPKVSNGTQTGETSQTEADNALDNGTLQFRRLYVPESRINDVIRGEYVPMARDRFEQILKQTQGGGTLQQAVPLAIQSATYSATFKEGQLIDGQAWLSIEAPTLGRRYEFPTSNLPINSPVWPNAFLDPAQIDLVDGKELVEVRSEGPLRFQWSKRPEPNLMGMESNEYVFDLDLPDAVSSHLLIKIPRGFSLVADTDAIVAVINDVPEPSSILDDGEREFWIEPLVSGNLRLRVTSKQALARTANGTRQIETRVQLDSAGIRLEHRERLSATAQWPSELVFQTDQAIAIDNVSIRIVGETKPEAELAAAAIPCEVAEEIGQHGENLIRISLPRIADRSIAELNLVGYLPAPQSSTVPLIRLNLENWIWSEESSYIEYPRQFHCGLLPNELLFAEREPPTKADSLRRLKVTHLLEGTQPALEFTELLPEIVVNQLTIIRALAGAFESDTALVLEARQGNLSEFEIATPKSWEVIDLAGELMSSKEASLTGDNGTGSTATSAPNPTANSNRGLIEQWKILGGDDTRDRIRIRLRRSLRQGEKMRVQLKSTRRRFPQPEEDLGTLELVQVEVNDAVTVSKYVALSADTNYQFRLRHSQYLQPSQRADLVDDLQAVMPESPFDHLIKLDHRSDLLQVRVAPQAIGSVDARVNVEALVTPGQLVESYEFVCLPSDAKIDRVFVHFSEQREEDLEWEFGGNFENRLRARRVDSGSDGSILIGRGETWRIDLLSPVEGEFTLRTNRTSAWQTGGNFSLASIEQANSQSGMIVVRSEGLPAPQIDGIKVEEETAPIYFDDNTTRTTGTYSYVPGSNAVLRFTARIAPESSPMKQAQSAYEILRLEGVSRLSGPQLEHRIRAVINSKGRRKLYLCLPIEATLGSIESDDGMVTAKKWSPPPAIDAFDGKANSGEVSNSEQVSEQSEVPKRSDVLPPSRESQWFELTVQSESSELFQLTVVYSTPAEPVRFWGPVRWQIPRFDGVLIERQWEFLPGRLHADSFNIQHAEPALYLSENVRQRLFSLLARRPNGAVQNGNPFATQQTSQARRSMHVDLGYEETEEAGLGEPLDRKLPEVEVQVYRRAALLVAQLGLLSLGLFLGWLIFVRRLGWGFTFNSWGLVLLLVVPFSWTLLASPIWLGTSMGMLLALVQRLLPRPWNVYTASSESSRNGSRSGSRTANRTANRGGSRSGFGTLLLMVLASLGILAIGSSLRASPSSHSIRKPGHAIANNEKESDYFKVVIPIGKERKPVGNLVFLPREFYEQLLIADRRAEQVPIENRLGDADYQVRLGWNENGSNLRVQEVTVRLQVDTSRRDTVFELPFETNRLTLIQNRLTLDGREPFIDPQPNGQLLITIPQPGEHLIEFAFIPPTKGIIDRQGFEITTPRIASATCRVEVPDDAPEIRFGECCGAHSHDLLRSLYEAELGPVSKLSLNWDARGSMMGGAQRERSIERAVWLTAGEQVVVQGAMELGSEIGKTSLNLSLPYQVEPGWQLRLDDSQATLRRPATPNQPGLIALRRSDVNEPFRISFTMLPQQMNGIGRFRIPDFWVGRPDIGRDFYAISASSGFAARFEASQGQMLESPDEFLERWTRMAGVESSPPVSARAVVDRGDVHVIVSPVARVMEETSNQTLVIDSEWLNYKYTANLAVIRGALGQIQVPLPDDMTVSDVALASALTPTTWDWYINRDRMLIVLPNQPLVGMVQLEIQARQKFQPEFVLPRLGIIGTNSVEARYEVLRRERIDVDFQKPLLLDRFEAWDVENEAWSIANFTLSDFTEPVKVRANVREGESAARDWQIVTTIEQEQEGWKASIHVRFQLPEAGMRLDACHLRFPANWGNSIELDLPGTTEWIPQAGNASGILVVRPDQSFREQVEFDITARLRGSFSLPNVHAADESIETLRFMMLPKQGLKGPITWETVALAPFDIGDLEIDNQNQSDLFESYLCETDQATATVLANEQEANRPQITLLDQLYSVQESGFYVATARIDFVPSGQNDLVLELPANAKLLRAQTSGIENTVSQIQDGAWNLSVMTPKLPHQIELTYSGFASRRFQNGSEQDDEETIKRLELTAPRFRGINVELTTWQIVTAHEATTFRITEIEKSIDRAGQQLQRLRAINRSIRFASGNAAELDSQSRARWFGHWGLAFFRILEDEQPGVNWLQLWSQSNENQASNRVLDAASLPRSGDTSRLQEFVEQLEEFRSFAIGFGVESTLQELLEQRGVQGDNQVRYRSSDSSVLQRLMGPKSQETSFRPLILGSTDDRVIRLEAVPSMESKAIGRIRLFAALLLLAVVAVCQVSKIRMIGRRYLTGWIILGILLIAILWFYWLSPVWVGAVWLLLAVGLVLIKLRTRRRVRKRVFQTRAVS